MDENFFLARCSFPATSRGIRQDHGDSDEDVDCIHVDAHRPGRKEKRVRRGNYEASKGLVGLA